MKSKLPNMQDCIDKFCEENNCEFIGRFNSTESKTSWTCGIIYRFQMNHSRAIIEHSMFHLRSNFRKTI